MIEKPVLALQMSILDGNAYDNKCLETGQEREDDLDACSLLLNNKVPARFRLHAAMLCCGRPAACIA